VAERRVCSVLFCDVVGFTPLSEARGEEAVRRQHSIPYHLAHGLLDHAEHLRRTGEDQAGEAAIGEAAGITDRLRCQPLLDRAADLSPAGSRMRTPIVPAPGSRGSAAVRDE
jgi:class 3 adenylate cyclase